MAGFDEKRRQERLYRAVSHGLRKWVERGGVELAEVTVAPHAEPLMRRTVYAVSRFRVLARMFIWLWAAIRYLSGSLFDALRRRNSRARRAVRLRKIFETLGPTFIKLGQQLSAVLEYDGLVQKVIDATTRLAGLASSHCKRLLVLNLSLLKADPHEKAHNQQNGSRDNCQFHGRGNLESLRIDSNSQASACKNLVSFICQGEQRLTTQTERPRSCWQANGRDAQSGSIQCLVRRRISRNSFRAR